MLSLSPHPFKFENMHLLNYVKNCKIAIHSVSWDFFVIQLLQTLMFMLQEVATSNYTDLGICLTVLLCCFLDRLEFYLLLHRTAGHDVFTLETSILGPSKPTSPYGHFFFYPGMKTFSIKLL